MKRVPLTRKTPLARGGRVRPVNPARRRRAFARNFGERGEAVRAMRCLLHGTGCMGQVQAAHVRSRGAGGDRRELVPLCAGHHEEQGRTGIKTFQARHSINLPEHAARIAVELDAQGVP